MISPGPLSLLIGLLTGGVTVGTAAPPALTKCDARTLGCGEVNIFFTGLPPYHPLVTAQGFDPAKVDAALRADAADILKAGYNSRVVLMGPEQPISVLSSQLEGIAWDGTGVGYGVRGSSREDLTIRLEDILQLYRTQNQTSGQSQPFILFDHSPSTGLWAIQRRFPLTGDCTDNPGQDLGFEIFCDPDVCTTGNSSSNRA